MSPVVFVGRGYFVEAYGVKFPLVKVIFHFVFRSLMCVCVFCFIVLLCVTLQFFMIIQAF